MIVRNEDVVNNIVEGSIVRSLTLYQATNPSLPSPPLSNEGGNHPHLTQPAPSLEHSTREPFSLPFSIPLSRFPVLGWFNLCRAANSTLYPRVGVNQGRTVMQHGRGGRKLRGIALQPRGRDRLRY